MRIGALFVLWLLLGPGLILLGNSLKHDDTDPPNGHSGMSLYTDARTGCQYVGIPFGSLTPRLDAQGKQICGRQ
jgi:hypothetical protein